MHIWLCDSCCCHSSGWASVLVYAFISSLACGVSRLGGEDASGLDELVCEGALCQGVVSPEHVGCSSPSLPSRVIVAWILALC